MNPPRENEETEFDSQPQQEVEDQAVEAQPEATENVWTHQREEDLNQRLRDGGEVTDEELEGYDEWVNSGKPTPEPEDETNDEEEKDLTATEPEAGSEVEESDSSKDPDSDEDIKSVMDAMKAVGAKTYAELPDKIKGLRSQIGKQGGELGNQLKERESQLQNMTNLLNDVAAGKPEALEYLKKVNPSFQGFGQAQEAPKQKEMKAAPEGILDDTLYEYVQGLEAKIQQLEGHHTQSQEKATQYLAIERTANEIADFAKQHPEYYNASADVGGLVREYLGQSDSDPVDPRLTKIHDLMQYAKDNGLKNLEDAHWLMNRQSISQRIIDARNEGRQSMDYKPNPGLSGQRRSGSEQQYKQYSEAEVQDIIHGRKPIPADWVDANDNFVVDKIPATARKYITGLQ